MITMIYIYIYRERECTTTTTTTTDDGDGADDDDGEHTIITRNNISSRSARGPRSEAGAPREDPPYTI